MTILKIKPIAYVGQRLHEASSRVVLALPYLFEGFEMLPPVRLHEYWNHNNLKMSDFIRYIESADPYTIGVTSLPVYNGSDNEEDPVAMPEEDPVKTLDKQNPIGVSIDRSRIAVVKADDSIFGQIDSDRYVHGLSSVMSHEVGHWYSLRHHEGKKRTSLGNLCSMTNGKHVEGLTMTEFLEQRDVGFCDDCIRVAVIAKRRPPHK